MRGGWRLHWRHTRARQEIAQGGAHRRVEELGELGIEGGLGLVVLALTPRSAPWPPLRELAAVPAHLWFIGGTLGATFVVTALWAAPKIGAGVLFSTLVAAQLCTSLVFDHFGLLGLPEKAANLQRVAGAGLLIAGAVLMARG